MPELLVPAGNREKLETAIIYGANAVYLGGTEMNLRASCQGFTPNELVEAVILAHENAVQVYYCLNSLPMQEDLTGIPAIIEQAAVAGVDAFIIADPGIFRLARKHAPHIPVHISTQANSTNSESMAFWYDLGAVRVNLARELTARNIYAIQRSLPQMETEVFVHGAMCLAVSGKCLLSAWLNQRPANLGRCTHPCRFEYGNISGPGEISLHDQAAPDEDPCPSLAVEERTRPGTPVWHVQKGGSEAGERYSSVWAPEDLCLMPYLKWFVDNNITSLKVEGRMKGAGYTAHVADAYSTALACLSTNRQQFDYKKYMPDLFHTASRPLSSGFFIPGERRVFSNDMQKHIPQGESTTHHEMVAKLSEPVGDGSSWIVEVRGKWLTDKPVEIMLPGMQRPIITPASVENRNGEQSAVVHSGTRAVLHLPAEASVALNASLRPGLFLRSI